MTTRGVDYQAVNYLEEPLSADALKRLLKIAGLKAEDILRTKEEAYAKYVAGRNLTDEQLIEAMAKHPELIQRPIVVIGDKAVLARPIDKLAELGIK